MITVNPKITQKLEVDIVTDDGKDINDILKEICEIAHDGLMDASLIRQECDENPSLNTAKNWREECENLEGKLCSILDLLKD